VGGIQSVPDGAIGRPMATYVVSTRGYMLSLIARLWFEDDGQDIAEYAVMLAVILVIVVGTLRLIGSNANNAFSSVASSLH
jgi:Flp pilus assembly pilin Flp